MFSAPCDFVSTAPYSYKFGPSSGTALLTMTVADYSRQALLRQCCCIEVRESSSGKNAFFPTMYLLHLHLGFRVASDFILFCRLTHLRMPYAVSVRQVSGLPPASFRSRLAADTLALGYVLGATPCTRDFHPLERAHAERTVRKLRAFKRGLFSESAAAIFSASACGSNSRSTVCPRPSSVSLASAAKACESVPPLRWCSRRPQSEFSFLYQSPSVFCFFLQKTCFSSHLSDF